MQVSWSNNDDDDNNHIKRRNLRYFTMSSLRHCFQLIRSSGQRAIVFKSHAAHWALITCNMSSAMCYEGTAQLLLSLTELKLHLL